MNFYHSIIHFQDAFFGRELLDTSKDNSRDIESSDSDSAGTSSAWKMSSSETVVLSQVRIIHLLFFFLIKISVFE